MNDNGTRVVAVSTDRWRELRDLWEGVPETRRASIPVLTVREGDVSEIEWRTRARRFAAGGFAEMALAADGRPLGVARAYVDAGVSEPDAFLTHFYSVGRDVEILRLLVDRAARWAAESGANNLVAGVYDTDPGRVERCEDVGFVSTGVVRESDNGSPEHEFVLSLAATRFNMRYLEDYEGPECGNGLGSA